MGNKLAIYPGTFDPVTIGHLDIVNRASLLFDKLIIAVAGDTPKNTLFSLEDRVDMVKYEVKSLRLCNVSVKSFYGLLINFVLQEKACVIVRGIRAVSDFEHEFQMAYMNHKLNNRIQTILLPSTENGSFISSSFVKEIAKVGGKVGSFVSDYVEVKLIAAFQGDGGSTKI
ncbi:Phosphopantetheine adenylyltransferase [Alphaproteobacteria bacterium]